MYNRIAKYITYEMLKNSIINREKFDIYVYGFELMIAYFFYFLSLILVAIITNTIIESLVFCFGFMLVRKCAGGYHTSSYLKCQILFILNQLIFVGCVKIFSENILIYFLPIVLLTMLVVMWLIAPIDNENKKLTDGEYNHFKKLSRVCSVIITLIIVVMFVFFKTHAVLFSFLMGVFSATVSVIVGCFQQKHIKNNIRR